MRHHRVLAAAFALAALGSSSEASAQGTALNRFDPSPAGDRLFGVQSPTTQGHVDVHAMLMADYAHNPFVLTHRLGASDVGGVVGHQLNLHLNASLALWNHLTVGLEAPLAVVQDGSDSVFRGQTLEAPSDVHFGDLRLHLKGSILGRQDDLFQLGVGGYLWMPTGKRDAYVSDGNVRGSLELLLGGLAGPFYWNLATGPQFRKSHQIMDVEQGHMWQWGGGFGVLLGDDQQVQLGPEFKASITMKDVRNRNTNAEVLLGVKYRFLDVLQIGAAAGPGVAEGIGTPDFRGVVMFGYSPDTRDKPVLDSDGDLIPDSADACVDKAGVASADRKLNGCPPPPPDEDGDGVPDAVDACAGVAGPASDDASKNGCPLDTDGDGIPDVSDACPERAAKAGDADPVKLGCPLDDADGDGVKDDVDACRDIAGVSSADPATNGCPGDSDGDGFRDDQDACPQTRGVDDPDPTKRGCAKTVRLVGKEIVILQQVQFATGTATIKAESNELLDDVAQVLRDHSEILKVEVQGHTDDTGAAELNRRLSQQRADAVVKALIERGVQADRLTAKGYGPDQPVADNTSDEGRAKNRRVQFKITERKQP